MSNWLFDWSGERGAAALVVRSVGVIPLHRCHGIFSSLFEQNSHL